MVELIDPKKEFHLNGKPYKLDNGKRTIQKFWQWCYSDLLQNITRGILAEYLIAWAIDVDDKPQDPWHAFDLKTKDGKRIEVKTTGYLQSWYQKRQLPKNIQPRFVISPSREWTAEDGMKETPTFNADIYVLCYHKEKDFDKIDPMDISQWDFWVFSINELKHVLEGRKSISVSKLIKKGYSPISLLEINKKIN